MDWIIRLARRRLPLAFAALLFGAIPAQAQDDKCKLSPVYNSQGVHNGCYCGGAPDGEGCIAERSKTDPPDPRYPDQWISQWSMYRVFDGYQDKLPPWDNPPGGLVAGEDYEVSYGATYYDNTYVPADGDGTGAMMEHYERRCLPIFPIDSDFSCSFISLGNKAYFLTYQQDRPANMPACCLFSPYNHPPRPDFIKHLPYSPVDSQHVNDSLQAYRYVAPFSGSPEDIQKAKEGDGIWFAYAFHRDQWLDETKQYLKPQSFYFSGSPTNPPNAPFVSQNYTDFRIETPDPVETWDQVARMCPDNPPPCHLFQPESTTTTLAVGAEAKADWSNLPERKGVSQ